MIVSIYYSSRVHRHQVGMLFAVGVAVHMAVRVPCNFLWRWAAGRFGKYPTYMCLDLVGHPLMSFKSA